MKKRKPPVAISDKGGWEFGCPYCSYNEAMFLERRSGPGGTCALFACKKCKGKYVVLSGKMRVSLIGFKLGGVVNYPRLQMHPRRKKELRKTVRKVVREIRQVDEKDDFSIYGNPSLYDPSDSGR